MSSMYSIYYYYYYYLIIKSALYISLFRDETVEKIINLLNTQAVYLDTTEVSKNSNNIKLVTKTNCENFFLLQYIQVMELLPEYWSVEMLSEFLIRSLRQNYHDYREGQILKGLCRGENTMVCDIF